MKGEAKGDKAMEMFKLAKQSGSLPEKIEDLVPMTFIGEAAVTFYKAKVKAMNHLKMTEEQRKATLRDGQDAGEMLLDIEARIGQLLPSGKQPGQERGKVRGQGTDRGGRFTAVLPEGLTKARVAQSRKIAENPEIVERIKKQARENDDIATKTAVLSAIGYEREKQNKVERQKALAALKIEEQTFIMRLEQCVRELTNQKPPKDWSKEGFDFAIALCKVITRRLSPFLETKQFKESVLRSKIEQVYYVED